MTDSPTNSAPSPPSPEVRTEMASIERQMGDKRSDYWRDGGQTQSHYRSLVEGGDAKPASRQEIVAVAEKGEIEGLMGSKNSAYWKGPDAAGLQARYLDLITGVPDLASVTEPEELFRTSEWKGAVEKAKSGLPPALVAQWGDDFDTRFLRASAAIDAIEKTGGTDITLGSSVASWGPEVSGPVVNELSLPADPAARPASKEQLDAFTKSADRPENADLVWAWGRDAAHNLGILNTRFNRLEASMAPEGWEQVRFLMDHLEPGERKAIFDVLIEA